MCVWRGSKKQTIENIKWLKERQQNIVEKKLEDMKKLENTRQVN
jgi:hypothetical protein